MSYSCPVIQNDGNLNKGSDPSLLSTSIDISNSHGQNQRQADYYESPSDSFEDDDCDDYEVEDDNCNKDNVKSKKVTFCRSQFFDI